MKQDLPKSHGDFIRPVNHGMAHRPFCALHHSELFQVFLVAGFLWSKSFSISVLQKRTLVFLCNLSLNKKQKKMRCPPVNLARIVFYPVFMSMEGNGKRMEGIRYYVLWQGTTVFYYNQSTNISFSENKAQYPGSYFWDTKYPSIPDRYPEWGLVQNCGWWASVPPTCCLNCHSPPTCKISQGSSYLKRRRRWDCLSLLWDYTVNSSSGTL